MDSNDTKDIKVFGSDDESLKLLGHLLSNETSRKIIGLLIENEMYTNQISKKLAISMSLVTHHLKKLEEIGVVTVTKKPIIRKGIEHKFYKMIPNLFVATNQTKEEMHQNGFFKKFFKDGIKFAVIAFAGFTSWISATTNDMFQSGSEGITESIVVKSPSNFVYVPIIIIGCSLFLIWFTKKYK